MRQLLHEAAQDARKRVRRLLLGKKSLSIVANNCWGGFMCQHFGLEYASPFVGLFLFAPDYIALLKDLRGHLEKRLVFIDPETSKYRDELVRYGTLGKYPVGKIGDVEIHFLHYRDCTEALTKWNRRLTRLDYRNLIVKFCDRDLATPALIEEFDRLPYRNKICLTAKDYGLLSCLRIKNENGECVMDEWKNFTLTVEPWLFVRTLFSGHPEWLRFVCRR